TIAARNGHRLPRPAAVAVPATATAPATTAAGRGSRWPFRAAMVVAGLAVVRLLGSGAELV
ncbi:hypothetical protein ACPW7O_28520, partial [Streptomyces tunisiensis]